MAEEATRVAARVKRAVRPWGGACVGALALCLSLWAGCSVEKNYKTLSFFFDGVPDPSKRIKTADGQVATEDIRKSPTYSVHKPYASDQCAECHAGRYQMTRNDSGVCLKCHADETSKHARMHGPVAAAACMWCHSPHESAYAKLFVAEPRQVCTQCHVPQLLSDERVPEHADSKRSCLECHFGHGGTAAFMLRDGVKPVPVQPGKEP